MAGVEVGPNDIVIHLVNPYRCGDCEAEFFLRTDFLEHLAGHIASVKSERPCHQIVCVTRAMEHAPTGITVTRDILQINEQQLFELQDPTLDVSQLPSLKALEQAGILKLPQPKQTQTTTMPPFMSANGTFEKRISGGKRQVSLLKHLQQSKVRTTRANVVPSIFRELSMELERDADLVTIASGPDGDVQFVSSDFSDPKIINALMQQAMLDVEQTIKVEDGSPAAYAQEPMTIYAEGNRLNVDIKQEEETRDKVIRGGKKSFTLRDAKNPPQNHQRQHTCPVCHKMYDRLAQLMFHMKHHDKKKFIQFGSKFHEVRVNCSRNEEGQMVQEHYLLLLLSKEELSTLETDAASVMSAPNFSKVTDSIDAADSDKNNFSSIDVSEQQKTNIESDSTVKNINPLSYEVLNDEEASELAKESVDRQSSESQHICASGKDQIVKGSSIYSVDPKKMLYKCGHCKRVFFTRSALSRHLIKHTNTKPFQCDKCLKSFRDKTDLFHHGRTHTKPVQCPTCNLTFSKSLYLRNHLVKGCPKQPSDDRIAVLQDMRCLCKVCDKVLKSKSNAIRHLRIHDFQERSRLKRKAESESNNFETVTNTSQNIEDHYKPLENSVGFQCLLCGEEMRFKSFMVTHVRRHLNQRPFQCDQCPKSFFARHVLRKHQQHHTKPYKCPVCGKGFMRRYMMTKHFSKRHDIPEGAEDPMKDITELPDQKLIQCDICGKTMKQCLKSNMLYHIRLHKDVRPFKCDKCPKSFISENALKKHDLTHSKPYVCQVCGMSFSRRYLLTDHFKKICIFKIGNSKVISSTEAISDKSQSLSVSKSIQSDLDIVDQQIGKTYNAGAEKENKCSSLSNNDYFCEPCNKHFTVFDTFLRHMNTFSKSTACKYCKQIFQDKHIAMAHQRSCLGTVLPDKISGTPKRGKSAITGGWQKRVKIMREVDETIQLTHQVGADVDKDGMMGMMTLSSKDSENKTGEGNRSETGDLTLSSTVEALKSKQGKYCCPQCDRVFSTPRGLKIHASVHIRLFKCEVCDVEFKSLKSLRAHHTQKHNEKETDAPNTLANGERLAVDETECTEKYDQSPHVSKADRDNFLPNQSEASFALLSLANATATANTIEDTDQIVQPNSANQSPPNLGKGHHLDPDDQDSTIDTQAEPEMKLMQLGTRGRPYRCQLCRKRFTQQDNLDAHIILAH